MAERYQLPQSCVPPTTRRKDCGCPPSGGSEGGKTRCIREREDMVAFQGGHPPFKGDSPYLRPQPSWAESSPTRSKVLPLRHGGWVPRVMQADPEQKEPNRRARCMQPPSGYVHSSTFAQTSGRKGGQPCRRHATAPSGCAPPTSNAPSMGGPRPHVMQPARRSLRASNCTATRTTAMPPRLRNQYRNSRQPCTRPSSASQRRRSIRQKWAGSNGGGRRAGAAVTSSAKLTSRLGAARETSLMA
jgi:hypothetical protein